MKLLLLLTLSSALCYGQVRVWGGQSTAMYAFPMGAGQTRGQGNIAFFFTPDTPLADRNPNDFYVDTLDAPMWVTPIMPVQSYHYKPLSLEEKLLLYAEECYNDSMSQGIHSEPNFCHMPYGDVPLGVLCDYPSHWTIIYIHVEPTLKGFAEWLKKK